MNRIIHGYFFVAKALIIGLCVFAVSIFYSACAQANCSVPHEKKDKAHALQKEAELKYGLAPGSEAPDFEADTDIGEKFKLSEALKNGPVILVFYRGGWCPYCSKQLNGLKEDKAKFDALGATLVALSVDRVEKEQETQIKSELGFPLLSDPDAMIIADYNLIFQLDAPTLKTYQGYGINVEDASGRTHHQIAVPGVFVIAQDGHIAWTYVNEDYKVRADNEDVLKALRDLQSASDAEESY